MQFEEVLRSVGGSHRYQWRLLLVLTLVFSIASDSLIINFSARPVDYRCRLPIAMKDLPVADQKSLALPPDPHHPDSYNHCHMYDIDYAKLMSLRKDRLHPEKYNKMLKSRNSTTPCKSWHFHINDRSWSMVSDWELVCSRQWLISAISSAYMAGVLLGSCLGGWMSDYLGRSRTIGWGLGLKLIAGTAASLFNYMPVFLSLRALQAMGGHAAFQACYVILMETVDPDWRSTFGIIFVFHTPLSTLVMIYTSYYLENQSHVFLQLCAVLPVLLAYLYWPWMEESARWLLVKGRHLEALDVMKSIAKTNGKHDPANLLDQLKQVTLKTDNKQSSMWQLFNFPRLRRRTLIICYHWFTDSMMYYGIMLNAGSLYGDIYFIFLLLTLTDLAAMALSHYGLRWRRTGRRLTCSFVLILAGISSFFQIPFILLNYNNMVTILALSGKTFISAGFNSIYVYSAELFPTEVRNSGIGLGSTAARISGIISPFLGPPLATLWSPLPAIIFAVVATSSGILTLYLPETLNQKLPETIPEAEEFTWKPDIEPNHGPRLIARSFLDPSTSKQSEYKLRLLTDNDTELVRYSDQY